MAKGGKPGQAGPGNPRAAPEHRRETGSRGRRETMGSDPRGFTDAGYPEVFEGTRPTPEACDYDGSTGLPVGHIAAKNAAPNLGPATRLRPSQNRPEGGAGVSFPNFKSGR